jgi:hypothetical protein
VTLDLQTTLLLVFGPVPVSLAVMFVAKAAVNGSIKHFFDRSIAEFKSEAATELAQLKSRLQAEAERVREERKVSLDRDERVRAVLAELSAPALDTIASLRRRLKNILEEELADALAAGFTARPGWSMTHDYARTSTVYIVGKYFALRSRLCSALGNEVFDADGKREEFVNTLYKVGGLLSAYPLLDSAGNDLLAALPAPEQDMQIFSFQQDAIGTAMTKSANGAQASLDYVELLGALADPTRGPTLGALLKPLDDFLEHISAAPRVRKRLELFSSALEEEVERACKRVLARESSH